VGFRHALRYPYLTTLELDLTISAEGVPVVSHEPWFSSEICIDSLGRPLQPTDTFANRLYSRLVSEIQTFDCGSSPHPRFPHQQRQKAAKPTLQQVFDTVEPLVHQRQGLIRYNIEIKSTPAWDSVFTPKPTEFALAVWNVVSAARLQDRVTVQSFDIRPLQVLHKMAPELSLALLIEETDHRPIDKQLAALGFVPAIYSPHYSLVNPALVAWCHAREILVIPWTVNQPEDMIRLIDLGVDGLITDYPSLFKPEWVE
jgi:glycerophosphoryl diester phosphodiesterase